MPDFPDWQEVGPVRYVDQLAVPADAAPHSLSVPVSGYERSIILYPAGDLTQQLQVQVIGDTTGSVVFGYVKAPPNHPLIVTISPETEASYTVRAIQSGPFATWVQVYVGTAQPIIQLGVGGHPRAIPVLSVPDTGQNELPSYVCMVTSASIATAGDHLLQIVGGISQGAWLTKAMLFQNVSATAGLFNRIEVRRLTTAGTGGTPVTVTPVNPNQGSVGYAALTIPGVKGAEGALYGFWEGLFVPGVATVPQSFPPLEWGPASGGAPVYIPPGGAEGVVFKNNVAVAGASVGIIAWLQAL